MCSQSLSLKSLLFVGLILAVSPCLLVAASNSQENLQESHLQENHWQSPRQQATLIELFTSEGCSSCPSADRWLSKLEDSKGLWTQWVPVAFHVDYWNYLGWVDKYARTEYSKRQRRYKQQGHSDSVYTPGFMVNGKEWRGFFKRSPLPASSANNVGILSAELSKRARQLSVQFKPEMNSKKKPLQLYVALLGMGIDSPIKAGENHGRKLHHEFVVLNLQREKASYSESGYHWQLPMDLQPVRDEGVDAIALWVTGEGSLVPIQATGGEL